MWGELKWDESVPRTSVDLLRNWTDPRIFPGLRKIAFPDTVVDNCCEGASNGISHHFNEYRDTVGASRRVGS